jgi:hypothetical protein
MVGPYDFSIKTMFGSFLPPVVCRRVHVLFTLFVFDCSFVVSITYCVVFCFSSSCVPYMLPISLDCPCLIAPSVFSNVYLVSIRRIRVFYIDCSFGIL